MVMANNSTPNKSAARTVDSNLPPIQTNFTPENDLTTFERQVDCSRTVDLYGGTQIVSNLKIVNCTTWCIFINLTRYYNRIINYVYQTQALNL